MRKYAYLARLEELLAALPAQERQDALNYYEEYFDAAGSENEEQTAAELGDPADVARNILEGEGIEATEAAPGPGAPGKAETPPEPQTTGTVPPAGPEPPPLEDPEAYPRKGTGTSGASRPKVTRRIWLAFWLLVAVALVIQLSVLALGLGRNRGGESAYAAEYAESTTASSQELAAEGPVPTDAGQTGLSGSGLVTYTAELQPGQGGVLDVWMNRGNLAFRTGEVGKIEVRNVDVSQNVTFTDNGTESSFRCESDDPATHVTIILPPDAYESIRVGIAGSGAVELGNLKAEEINVYTADGPIQSGWVQAGTLNLQTDRGNIWLEELTDGTGYHLENVKLLAPQGSVSLTLPGKAAQWETKITNGQQYTKTVLASEPVQGIARRLEVKHGSSLKLEYQD